MNNYSNVCFESLTQGIELMMSNALLALAAQGTRENNDQDLMTTIQNNLNKCSIMRSTLNSLCGNQEKKVFQSPQQHRYYISAIDSLPQSCIMAGCCLTKLPALHELFVFDDILPGLLPLPVTHPGGGEENQDHRQEGGEEVRGGEEEIHEEINQSESESRDHEAGGGESGGRASEGDHEEAGGGESRARASEGDHETGGGEGDHEARGGESGGRGSKGDHEEARGGESRGRANEEEKQ